MGHQLPGIHHVTAIAGDPQRNLHFYTGVLGLRLVKLTVNYDDPGTYHFYFADAAGTPGTVMTFFPWPGANPGRQGKGQLTVTSFSVPPDSFGYWSDRLRARNMVAREASRFDEQVIEFRDPDGLKLELVAAEDSREPWTGGPVPAEYGIRGFHSVTLSEEGHQKTERLLTENLGFRVDRQAGNRFRYVAGDAGPGSIVDLECVPDQAPGRMGVGAVHHVAWRARTGAEQEAVRLELADAGHNVTPVIDRNYFRSIYFREPGGVLFEIATDAPGFAVDEAPDRLGSRLSLPPWLEAKRAYIEAHLPPLQLPEVARGA